MGEATSKYNVNMVYTGVKSEKLVIVHMYASIHMVNTCTGVHRVNAGVHMVNAGVLLLHDLEGNNGSMVERERDQT